MTDPEGGETRDEPGEGAEERATRTRGVTVPILGGLVLTFAGALILSLLNGSPRTLSTKSAADTVRIACSELAQINPSAAPRSKEFKAMLDRISLIDAAGQLAAMLNSADKPVAHKLEQPGIGLQLTYKLEASRLRAAQSVCHR